MEVKIIHSDDWVALYVDGEVKAQGHSLPPRDVLAAVDIESTDHGVEQEYDERVLAMEGFPVYFEEFPEGVLT